MTILETDSQPPEDAWAQLFYAWQMPWRMSVQWWEFYAEALHVAGTHLPHGRPQLMPKEQEPLQVEEAEGICA